MKLIIDIPEDLYKENIRGTASDIQREKIIKCVKNGTPLPKGHGRLIDENDLWFEDIDNISCVTQRDVENAPTIIEADKAESEVHCNCTKEEIAKSFIEDVEAVKDLLPKIESEE